jgi:rfaE bifunctional protein kinase chain/domain
VVLGDVMLDRYWWGDALRLSPEAPVPVVSIQRSSALPGGAANSAANLIGLGASARLFSVVGDDAEATELASICEECGIDATGLIREPGRPTTTKTRVIAQHQHVVRVDREEVAPLPANKGDLMLRAVLAALPSCDGVVVSDYCKGALPPGLLSQIIGAAREARRPVFVDPKGRDHGRYSGCTLLKPNRAELGLLSGLPTDTLQHTLDAGRALSRKMPGIHILVTAGAEGMMLFAEGELVASQPAQKREVFDVTGAGDTVLAAMAAALCGGASHAEAMYIASHAAALTISILGTYAVRFRDLESAMFDEREGDGPS